MTVFTWFRMAAWSSVSMRVYGQKTAPTPRSQEYFTLSNRLVLFFLCCFLRFLTAGWYRCCGEGCFTRRQCSQFAQYPGHHHCMSSSSYVKKSCSTYLTLKKGLSQCHSTRCIVCITGLSSTLQNSFCKSCSSLHCPAPPSCSLPVSL